MARAKGQRGTGKDKDVLKKRPDETKLVRKEKPVYPRPLVEPTLTKDILPGAAGHLG